MGLLKSANLEDYATASHYLQVPEDRSIDLEQLTRQLRGLRRYFEGDIALLSDNPNGTLERGLPPGEFRAGTLHVGNAYVNVILVRVPDPAAGKIWLISKESVTSAAKLLQGVKREPPTGLARLLPAALT